VSPMVVVTSLNDLPRGMIGSFLNVACGYHLGI
jgi:hypothetical protein